MDGEVGTAAGQVGVGVCVLVVGVGGMTEAS